MKEKIFTNLAPAPIGVYSQAVRVDKTIYLAGQIPFDPKTMSIVTEDIKSQVEQVFKNMQHVCTAAGGNMNDIVKLTVYLIDLANSPIVNDVMRHYFADPYPVRTTIQVSALPMRSLVEIDAIMVLNA